MAIERPGVVRALKPGEDMWLRGLLRNTRNVEMATPGPDGFPNYDHAI